MSGAIGNITKAVTPLSWDTQFFGFPVGEVSASSIKQLELTTDYKLLYVIADQPLKNNVIGDFICNYRGSHMIFYGQPIKTELTDSFIFRTLKPKDFSSALKTLALHAGHRSRFKMDPRIPLEQFESIYTRWIQKSLTGELADTVIGAYDKERLVGMVTVDYSNQEAKIGLISVSAANHNRGLGKALLSQAAKEFDIRITTQGDNIQAQKTFTSAGLRLSETKYMHHFWKN